MLAQITGEVYSWCKHQANPHHQPRKEDSEGEDNFQMSQLLNLPFVPAFRILVYICDFVAC